MTDMRDAGDRAADEVRRVFRRHLAAWASDLLALRRAGLDRPGRRTPRRAGDGVRRAA